MIDPNLNMMDLEAESQAVADSLHAEWDGQRLSTLRHALSMVAFLATCPDHAIQLMRDLVEALQYETDWSEQKVYRCAYRCFCRYQKALPLIEQCGPQPLFCFLLKETAYLSYAHIAHTMRIPQTTVKEHIAKVRDTLINEAQPSANGSK